MGSGVETLHFFQCRMALHDDGQCRVVSIRRSLNKLRYRAAGKKHSHDPTRSGFGKLVALLEWQIGIADWPTQASHAIGHLADRRGQLPEQSNATNFPKPKRVYSSRGY